MKENLHSTNLHESLEREVIDINYEFIITKHPWVLDVLSNCDKVEIPTYTIHRFMKYYLNELEVKKI
jgi:hypothetical protein